MTKDALNALNELSPLWRMVITIVTVVATMLGGGIQVTGNFTGQIERLVSDLGKHEKLLKEYGSKTNQNQYRLGTVSDRLGGHSNKNREQDNRIREMELLLASMKSLKIRPETFDDYRDSWRPE